MRIAMFTDTYLPSRDGVVTSIINTRRELQALGHEVFLFAPAPKDKNQRNDDVYYFKAKSFSKYQGYTIPMFPTDKSHILRKLDVDIIHTHGLLFQGLRSMFAGRNLKLPVVVTWHTMVTDAAKYYNFTPLPHWMVSNLMWVYLKVLIEKADCVIAPTNSIREELLKNAPKMRKVEVIPTGIDCETFRPENDGNELRKKWGIDDNRVILTLGRVAWEKNLDLILDGYAILRQEMPDTRLVIAGSGPAREHYMKKAKSMGLDSDVIFTGFVPDDELPKLYSACDAFTIASKFETQGLVILEAMASGKAVSGINYRAVGELIEDGKNGFKFGDTPQDWASATISALNASNALKRNARTTAESYSIRSCAERLVQVYEDAIAAKNDRSGKK